MSDNVRNWAIVLANVLLVLAVLVIASKTAAPGSSLAQKVFGAPGTRMKIEDYVPYVLYNDGIYSALGITSTATVTGGDLDATDDLTVGDDATVTGDLAVTSTATLSSTLAVTATTTLSRALVIGSSTPMSITGNAILLDNRTANATTTLVMTSINGTKGACLQLEGPASTTFRAYATTSGPLYVETGTCQ